MNVNTFSLPRGDSMADYKVDYRWDTDHAVPILFVTVTGSILSDPATIPTVIDETHTRIEQRTDLDSVYLAYDVTGTERTLPLAALMGRTLFSSKVKRVVLIGVRARTDEMSVLIMGTAKQVPYEYRFAETLADAAPHLYDQDDVQEC